MMPMVQRSAAGAGRPEKVIRSLPLRKNNHLDSKPSVERRYSAA